VRVWKQRGGPILYISRDPSLSLPVCRGVTVFFSKVFLLMCVVCQKLIDRSIEFEVFKKISKTGHHAIFFRFILVTVCGTVENCMNLQQKQILSEREQNIGEEKKKKTRAQEHAL
jgi:hypothetical protein